LVLARRQKERSMRKRNRQFKQKPDLALARALNDAISENEETMGEGAAYLVACDQCGVDPDDGWYLLADLAHSEENRKARATR
jgi:hypothetical protein